jgi:protein phosphatase
MKISYQTDVGLKRENNQDFVQIFQNNKNRTLAILADGMGGHKAGDVASRLSVERLGALWEETEFDGPENVSEWFIGHIQDIIDDAQQMRGSVLYLVQSIMDKHGVVG